MCCPRLSYILSSSNIFRATPWSAFHAKSHLCDCLRIFCSSYSTREVERLVAERGDEDCQMRERVRKKG